MIEPPGAQWQDPLDERITHPLLDQHVTVTLARAGDHVTCWMPEQPEPDRLTEPVQVTGTLMWVTAGGEAAVRTAYNQVVYCWPALEIEPGPCHDAAHGEPAISPVTRQAPATPPSPTV